MGVLDTTYTFTATDVVTSAKLNNVIDQTTFTSNAVATGNITLAVTASGQLKVNTSGIGANELADNSVNTAKILDANVTQAKIATNVVGKGPAFRAYANSATSLASAGFTKVTLDLENFDTNGNFLSSTFTPTVAGYYQINATVSISTSSTAATSLLAILRKNGVDHSYGSGQVISTAIRSSVSDIIEMNGTTDFIELFAYHLSGSSVNTQPESITTYMSGCLIRSA